MTKKMSISEEGETENMKGFNTTEVTEAEEMNICMEEIKKENKKAGKKFALVMVLCGILGGIMGFASVGAMKHISGISQAFESFMSANIVTIGIVIPVIMAVLTAVICMVSIYDVTKNKKNISHLIASDDDESLERIERKLSYDMWLCNGVMILNYFLFAVMIFADENFGKEGVPRISFYTVIVFLVFVITLIIVQQRLVDGVKLLNPEKKGSVYDLRFNKKWEESCDEVEKLIIYKSCYKAYQAVNLTCIILWMIFVLSGLVMGSGFSAVVCISVIWAVLICTYHYYVIKYSRKS